MRDDTKNGCVADYAFSGLRLRIEFKRRTLFYYSFFCLSQYIKSYVKSTAALSVVVLFKELEANWKSPVPPSLAKMETVTEVSP